MSAATPSTPTEDCARSAIADGIRARVATSVKRRTPFLSATVTAELAEDVGENVMGFLREVFEL